MKKQQTDLAHLGGKLTKTDMKKLKGGAEAEEGAGNGICWRCHDNRGYTVCIYTTNPEGLCDRYYGQSSGPGYQDCCHEECIRN
jgi:hypothetical protein